MPINMWQPTHAALGENCVLYVTSRIPLLSFLFPPGAPVPAFFTTRAPARSIHSSATSTNNNSRPQQMGKHTHGKARAARAGPAANAAAASQRRDAAGYPALAALAARHGRALHNVPGDDQCLFHALLHALEAQVRDPRATEYTALTLRHAILDLLCDPGLRERVWVAACDQDAVSLTNLRETLRANAARFEGRSLDEWEQAMRSPREYGDGNMLIGATLKLKRRIHVLSTADGVVTVQAPDIFGADYQATGDDLWLALHSDRHYLSTISLLPTGSPYQRLPTHQPNGPTDAPQRPTGGAQTGDERVAELERITSKGKLFKHWINDQYKAVCRLFKSSALKGTLYNGMNRAVRYERIVRAVRSDIHGAAVLAQVHIIAQDDASSRQTKQRRGDTSLAAVDRARNTEQRRVHRAEDPDANDAERERDREARRRRTDAKCEKPSLSPFPSMPALSLLTDPHSSPTSYYHTLTLTYSQSNPNSYSHSHSSFTHTLTLL